MRCCERPEYADYWAMKWCDLLRVKAEFPVNLWPNAVQAYHRWIITSLRENKPYDQFARELLTGCGSNFRDPQVNFYRSTQSKDPEEIARAVALTFMGTRADKWPPEKLQQMAKFFSYIGYKRTAEWKEEIVYFDYQKLLDEGPQQAVLPDGTTVQLTADKDPREVFADWLITNQNPWFARNLVNRAWFWLMGRGIIHEPDDIRDDNPPSNAKLLSELEKELTLSRYDLKAMYREITQLEGVSAVLDSAIGRSRGRGSCSPTIRSDAWTPRSWSMRSARSRGRPKSIPVRSPSRSPGSRNGSVPSRWRTGASPVRFWRCLGDRRVTRAWSWNGTTKSPLRSVCTCSTPPTSSTRSNAVPSCASW